MPVRALSPYVSKKQPPYTHSNLCLYIWRRNPREYKRIGAFERTIHYYFFNYNIMNKTEFIDAVSAKAGLSKADGKKAVDAMVETILSEMEKGEKVSILGFGSFSVVEKAARKGVNPRTKETIEIPARKVIKFKPGAELVSSVS